MSSLSFLVAASVSLFIFFFFNATATTELYTLSLHDALPICSWAMSSGSCTCTSPQPGTGCWPCSLRSEEHTSELQSPCNLVCRLLLEKKKLTSTLILHAKALRSHSSACNMNYRQRVDYSFNQ